MGVKLGCASMPVLQVNLCKQAAFVWLGALYAIMMACKAGLGRKLEGICCRPLDYLSMSLLCATLLVGIWGQEVHALAFDLTLSASLLLLLARHIKMQLKCQVFQ